MTTEEMKTEFESLFGEIINSQDISCVRTLGEVLKEMMGWMIANKPDLAMEWVEKMECVRWKNYLTPKEAERITSMMSPKVPWTFDQWQTAMAQHGYSTEDEPNYNRYALFAVMDMIMSNSSETLKKFIDSDNVFGAVYCLAADKLTDEDGMFKVREFFKLGQP